MPPIARYLHSDQNHIDFVATSPIVAVFRC